MLGERKERRGPLPSPQTSPILTHPPVGANTPETPYCMGIGRALTVEGQPGVPRRQLWVPAQSCGSCWSRLQDGPSVGPGA